MFSENDEDFLESLPLNVRDQTLMHVQEENKIEEKKNKTKQNKRNKSQIKEKKRKDNKIKYIIYTVIYLPGNGAKNLT